MKISHELRSQTIKSKQSSSTSKEFSPKMIASHIRVQKSQEIQSLMEQISEQGDKLVHFRSFRDLARFKRLIKQFLQTTVYEGLTLEVQQHFSVRGNSHKLSLVKQVDEKLIELTERLTDQEEETINLLDLIGEIKGLLINIYS